VAGTSRDAKRAASAQRILEAAREEFGSRGYDGATIRAIAERAGVHASLVMQHYGTKSALFAVAVRLEPDRPGEVADHLADVLGVRVEALPPETYALVRSMLTVPEAGASMREFLDERVANLAPSIGGPDAELRAAIVVSDILGLTIAQHFLELSAFAGRTPGEIAAAARATIEAGIAAGST
jgi:AcrR family transcriptional regulator